MERAPTLWEFCRAFFAGFFTAMSGPLSVPLALAAFYVGNDWVKVGLVATAALCLIAACYGVWAAERKKVRVLEGRFGERRTALMNALLRLRSLRIECVQLRGNIEAAGGLTDEDRKRIRETWDQIVEIATSISAPDAGRLKVIDTFNVQHHPPALWPDNFDGDLTAISFSEVIRRTDEFINKHTPPSWDQ